MFSVNILRHQLSLCAQHVLHPAQVKIEARQIVQGGWEADETVEAAAARETVEEAGVRGVLEVCAIACWHSFSFAGRHTLLHFVFAFACRP